MNVEGRSVKMMLCCVDSDREVRRGNMQIHSRTNTELPKAEFTLVESASERHIQFYFAAELCAQQ